MTAREAPRPPVADTAVLVRLADVSKTYSTGHTALRNINLAVKQGEFLSLLGPSGCGKSTLLRLIAGLAAPTSGAIDWSTDLPASRRQSKGDLGFVFQEPTLMPWANALDNVALPLILQGQAKEQAHQQARAKLALVGLEGFEHAFPRQLSGGMKMRVSIARALITEPSLLLMDEPFAALDEITRHRLNHDILELWTKLGFTAIFVTHSIFESVFLSDRIMIMAAAPGRIAAEVAVNAPFPRADTFRSSPLYGELCQETSERLKDAMARPGHAA